MGDHRGKEEASLPDPLEVKAVGDTLLSLGKVLKASRVYDSHNLAYQKLFQDCITHLTSFLATREVMTWEVGQFHIRYQGQIVYENRDPSESLASHLYKDGIRELHFYQGIEPWEIEELIEIFKTSLYEVDAEDDLATLFWEKDFPHLEPLVLDVLESGEGGEEGFDFSSLSQGLLEHGRAEPGSPGEGSSQGAESGPSGPQPRPPDLISPFRPEMLPLFSLREDEVERIQSEMEEEARKDLGQEFVDLLMEMLLAREEIEGMREILAIVERITESYCLQGDFHKAYNNVRLLRGLLEPSLDLAESRRNSVREAVERLGSPEKLMSLHPVLNQAEEEALLAFSSYAYLLGPPAITPLCEILGELKQMKARRILCNTIAQVAKGHIDRLGPAIKHPRWYVVRNVAYILGLMKDPQGVKYLKELVRHQEPRVKKEAIRSLGAIADPASREYLLSCLSSPDSLVQTSAARVLATIGEKRALPLLLGILEQRAFRNREKEERKAIFEAIGQLGSDELLPLLEKMLFRKSIFQRGAIEEMREGAGLALAVMGTAGAKRILQEGAKGKHKAIKEVCQSALSRLSGFPMRSEEEGAA
ncbi:MAG: HEAT repeat domain-containing protein [candidate division NC10 bacterium]|nr:HEAT repeat domain-containing protein [candidate division NC10 bacterium]